MCIIALKSESSDHTSSLDIAAYKMDWSALQLSVTTAAGVMTYNINAGKVTSEGFERPIAPIQQVIVPSFSPGSDLVNWLRPSLEQKW
jgi:hypothetical protein